MSRIIDLRNLWDDESNLYSYPIRIISEYFLRKHCFKWIFNSRIQNFSSPLKYIPRIREALKKP